VIFGVPFDNKEATQDGSVHFADAGTDTGRVNVSFIQGLVVDSVSEVSDGDFSAGQFTLREAIEVANATPGRAEITFNQQSGVFADSVDDTIFLSSALEITDGLTITGPGTAAVTLNGGNGGDLFNDFTQLVTIVAPQTNQFNVELAGLNFDRGVSGLDGNGGAIFAEYVGLTVRDSVFTRNVDASPLSDGTRENTIEAGGIFFRGDSRALNVIDSRFEDNLGSGIAVEVDSSPINIIRSEFDNNRAFFGGAINVQRDSGSTGGVFTLRDSVVTRNFADLEGGALFVEGESRILRSEFSFNEAFERGGGIFTSGDIEIVGSTLANNIASASIGLSSDGGGGAVFVDDGGTISLVNSTLSDNIAVGGDDERDRFGSVIFTAGRANGGAIETRGNLTAVNTTIVGNRIGGEGSGGGIFVSSPSATVLLTNTIVAGNDRRNIIGSIDPASQNNLVEDVFGDDLVNGVNGNIITTSSIPLDSIVGPLGDNGGPTRTRLLVEGSLAIDAGADLAAAGLNTDQRGRNRIAGNGIDIGAVEEQ